MKIKAGVITLYYNNFNYGGILQAYALIAALDKLGIEAKQIAFDRSHDKSPILPSRKERMKSNPVSFICEATHNKVINASRSILLKKNELQINDGIKNRIAAFRKFEDRIPHTEVVSCDDIQKLNNEFDVFVCGSDQIWNPEQFRNAYLLNFVPEFKKKVSYAASIGRDYMTEHQLKYLAEKLKTFHAISVRENAAKELLKECVRIPIEWVLDPTLLLSTEEWDAIMEEYIIDGEYIFTYFLGDNKQQRKAAKNYAKKKGLTLIGFPHILGNFRQNDEDFADYNLYDVTPAQFIYLIKNAKYVITDSFHACIFSIIYNRNFVVMERSVDSKNQKMNSRILSLLEMFDQSDRLVTPNKIDHVEIGIKPNLKKIEAMKISSLNFLKGSLT